MHQKLLQKAGLLGLMIVAAGYVLSGCIDEPNPPVIDRLTSRVRFVHADPSLGAVDLWVDGVKKASNVSYKGFVDYMDINSGVRLIQLTEAGKTDTVGALFAAPTSFRSLTQMLLFFYPGQNGLASYIAQEKFTYANEKTGINADSARVRVINLTSQGVAFFKGSETFLSEVAAGTLSPYRNCVASAAFTMDVKTSPANADITSVSVTPASKERFTYFLMGQGDLLILNDNSLPTYP